jgi:hypothetical protein
MENRSVREAVLKLREWFTVPPEISTPVSQREPTNSRAAIPADDNKPLPFALSHIDCSHPYLAGRVVIPMHDENGFLVAFAGRSVDQTDPKYRFQRRFRKSHVLFNPHRAAPTASLLLSLRVSSTASTYIERAGLAG